MRGLERGGIWGWGSGICEEGKEEGRAPAARCADTSPGSLGEERGSVVLKSYLANWFVVCMVGIVADGVGGSRGVLGIAGILRTDAGSVGEIGAQSGRCGENLLCPLGQSRAPGDREGWLSWINS